MPPSSPNLEMVISERPIYPTPEAYEPIPLEQLEDLEAMPSSGKFINYDYNINYNYNISYNYNINYNYKLQI